jgi:hypothetical protein
MATVQYESKENMGRKFWTGRYGRYAIRIDANRPGRLPVAHHPGGSLSPQGGRPNRNEAAAVSDALGRVATPPEVVDVMLADRELGATRQTAAGLRVEVSASAVVCRSSTWDGLATARTDPDSRGLDDGSPCRRGQNHLIIISEQYSTRAA